MKKIKNKFIVGIVQWVCDIAELLECIIKVLTLGLARLDIEYYLIDWLDAHGMELWVDVDELIEKLDEKEKK